VAFDPFILQQSMDPKAVQTRLLHNDDRNDLPCPEPYFVLKLGEPRQQPSDIAAAHRVL
jgi:hypothetical protein